jgi:hypothetical protein
MLSMSVSNDKNQGITKVEPARESYPNKAQKTDELSSPEFNNKSVQRELSVVAYNEQDSSVFSFSKVQ